MSYATDTPLRSPRWGVAKQTADDLTRHITAPPIPVLEIAEREGVDVLFIDFQEMNDEVAGFCDFEMKSIYVNENDPANRQTFTIAHELGHWMLHRKYYLEHPDKYPVLPRFGKPDNRNPMEKEANFFAAHLLVPDNLLRPVIDLPATRLAQLFLVSKLMMEYRVKNAREL